MSFGAAGIFAVGYNPEEKLKNATEGFGREEIKAMEDLLSLVRLWVWMESKNKEELPEIYEVLNATIKQVGRDRKGKGKAKANLDKIIAFLGPDTDDGTAFSRAVEDYMWACVHQDDQ